MAIRVHNTIKFAYFFDVRKVLRPVGIYVINLERLNELAPAFDFAFVSDRNISLLIAPFVRLEPPVEALIELFLGQHYGLTWHNVR